MFHRGPGVLRVLGALLVVLVVLAAGWGLYRVGFARGYAQGATLGAEDAPQARQALPHRPGRAIAPWGWSGRGFMPGMMWPHGGLFFPFFRFGGLLIFGLLGLAFLFALLRHRPWSYGPHGCDFRHSHAHSCAEQPQPAQPAPEAPAQPDASKPDQGA
jgi:hypothetical protein